MIPSKDKWFLFFKSIFNIDLYNYQLEIADILLEQKKRRIIITATTRAGKSYIIAMSSIVYSLLNPKKRIFIIAPTYKQASIIMEYIYSFLMTSAYLFNQTILTIDKAQLRKGKHMTIEHISFKNDSSIRILSAEGNGSRLMGWGGDLIVVDESALISDEVFNSKIMRMLGDSPDAILVEIGNPLSLNHFYEHFYNPDFTAIRIDWRQCVKEGRLSQQFIDEQRKLLTETEFKILYEAEFPEEFEDSLISAKKINDAVKRKVKFKDDTYYTCGIDVARFGTDLTVITVLETDGFSYRVAEIKSFNHTTITEVSGAVLDLHKKYKFKNVKVDDVGVGGGVTDLLKEYGLTVQPFIAGSKAHDEKRFYNKKIETAFKLKTLFDENRISIPKHQTLITELRKWKRDYKSDGRWVLIDPEDKSPDFADSLLIGISEHKGFVFDFI